MLRVVLGSLRYTILAVSPVAESKSCISKYAKEKQDADIFEGPNAEELKDFNFEPRSAYLVSKNKRICVFKDLSRIGCGSSPPQKIVACYSATVECK